MMHAFSSRVEKLKFRTKATAKSFNYSQPTKTCLKSTVETRKMTFNKQRQSPGLVHIKDILKDSTDFTEKLFGEFFWVAKKVFMENMCSSEFREIFRNSCSTELLWKLASVLELKKHYQKASIYLLLIEATHLLIPSGFLNILIAQILCICLSKYRQLGWTG